MDKENLAYFTAPRFEEAVRKGAQWLQDIDLKLAKSGKAAGMAGYSDRFLKEVERELILAERKIFKALNKGNMDAVREVVEPLAGAFRLLYYTSAQLSADGMAIIKQGDVVIRYRDWFEKGGDDCADQDSAYLLMSDRLNEVRSLLSLHNHFGLVCTKTLQKFDGLETTFQIWKQMNNQATRRTRPEISAEVLCTRLGAFFAPFAEEYLPDLFASSAFCFKKGFIGETGLYWQQDGTLPSSGRRRVYRAPVVRDSRSDDNGPPSAQEIAGFLSVSSMAADQSDPLPKGADFCESGLVSWFRARQKATEKPELPNSVGVSAMLDQIRATLPVREYIYSACTGVLPFCRNDDDIRQVAGFLSEAVIRYEGTCFMPRFKETDGGDTLCADYAIPDIVMFYRRDKETEATPASLPLFPADKNSWDALNKHYPFFNDTWYDTAGGPDRRTFLENAQLLADMLEDGHGRHSLAYGIRIALLTAGYDGEDCQNKAFAYENMLADVLYEAGDLPSRFVYPGYFTFQRRKVESGIAGFSLNDIAVKGMLKILSCIKPREKNGSPARMAAERFFTASMFADTPFTLTGRTTEFVGKRFYRSASRKISASVDRGGTASASVADKREAEGLCRHLLQAYLSVWLSKLVGKQQWVYAAPGRNEERSSYLRNREGKGPVRAGYEAFRLVLGSDFQVEEDDLDTLAGIVKEAATLAQDFGMNNLAGDVEKISFLLEDRDILSFSEILSRIARKFERYDTGFISVAPHEVDFSALNVKSVYGSEGLLIQGTHDFTVSEPLTCNTHFLDDVVGRLKDIYRKDPGAPPPSLFWTLVESVAQERAVRFDPGAGAVFDGVF